MKKNLPMLLIAASLAFTACGDTTGGNANAPKNAAGNNAATNKPADNASAEADAKKLISDLAAALNKNDAAALDKVYGDDYTLVTQSGEVTTKAARLELIKSGDLKFENVSFTDEKVRVYGDTAVILAKSSGKNTLKGKTAETNFQITFVANKGKDGWRLVSAQLTSIEGAAKAPDAAAKEEETKPATAANTTVDRE